MPETRLSASRVCGCRTVSETGTAGSCMQTVLYRMQGKRAEAETGEEIIYGQYSSSTRGTFTEPGTESKDSILPVCQMFDALIDDIRDMTWMPESP